MRIIIKTLTEKVGRLLSHFLLVRTLKKTQSRETLRSAYLQFYIVLVELGTYSRGRIAKLQKVRNARLYHKLIDSFVHSMG